MSTIFVVEQGSYSEYRVVGVYSTRENAELIAAKINKHDTFADATIAEWPLDSAITEINQGMQKYLVGMRKDGTVERAALQTYANFEANEIHELEREEFPNNPKPNALLATVWATDSQHAIKIVNEHRIQLLALNQWKGK